MPYSDGPPYIKFIRLSASKAVDLASRYGVAVTAHRSKAIAAFAERKVAGLNLSQRVWNITDSFYSEVESALDIALRDGVPADQLASELKQYLKHPDKLFRRVRDQHGQLQLSKRAKAFHPGQGVYRSSFKNARRLAVTETNMAYHTADHERWGELDFVLGYEVQVSGTNPNVCPICEELQGKYPKEFKWVGWHPHCRCHAVPILEKPENFKARMEALRRGDRVPLIGSVKELPRNFTAHLTANRDRITRSRSLPYFVRDNYLKNADGSLFPLFGYPTNASKLKAFKKKAQELLQGKTFRDGITISNKAIKEWLNQPHTAREAKDKWIFNIGQMLKNSTYLGKGVDKHDPRVRLHLYKTQIGAIESWVVVREFWNGIKRLHSVTDNKKILQFIEKPL